MTAMKWFVFNNVTVIITIIVNIQLLCGVLALNNGVGLTPPMGYSSWNDCASNVTAERIKYIVKALTDTGLAAKGYVHINVDEGWLKSRDSKTGEIIEDKTKFYSIHVDISKSHVANQTHQEMHSRVFAFLHRKIHTNLVYLPSNHFAQEYTRLCEQSIQCD